MYKENQDTNTAIVRVAGGRAQIKALDSFPPPFLPLFNLYNPLPYNSYQVSRVLSGIGFVGFNVAFTGNIGCVT